MRAAAPAARKPTCLRRPVIRADGEFWRGGSLRSEEKICVNPRELNVTKKGACRNSVGFEPSLLMRQPLFCQVWTNYPRGRFFPPEVDFSTGVDKLPRRSIFKFFSKNPWNIPRASVKAYDEHKKRKKLAADPSRRR